MGMQAETGSGQGGPPPTEFDDFHGGGGGDPEDRGASRRNSLTGIVVLMCASVMTFSAFLSAVIVSRGWQNWRHVPLPTIFWWNTGVLLLSSVFLDIARRRLRHGQRVAFNWWWLAATVLGFTFLGGQVIGWEQLIDRGFHLQGNVSSSFFYILTWAHATHAIAGLAALVYVAIHAFRFQMGPAKRTAVSVSVVFWHFLDVLWLMLMALFLAWF
jgi:cytochrome c oxidase subunit 3